MTSLRYNSIEISFKFTYIRFIKHEMRKEMILIPGIIRDGIPVSY